MQKEADTAPDPDLEIRGGGGVGSSSRPGNFRII